MAQNYLNKTGLSYFFDRLKAIFAPIAHDSTATTYGTGTDTKYGHVKLSDATNGSAAAAGGATAATPKAVADALTAATNAIPTATTTTPKMDGTAAVGSETKWAKGDHVHPTDTSRAPKSHATNATTYGAGTDANYGHVKLSDATNGTAAAASGGTAATPAAVKAVKDAIPAASTTNPSMDGTASYGSGTAYARANHVHPTDTSRAPLASPALTGTPTAPTAAAGTNTTQIATTAFVKAAVDASAANTTYDLSGTALPSDDDGFLITLTGSDSTTDDVLIPDLGSTNPTNLDRGLLTYADWSRFDTLETDFSGSTPDSFAPKNHASTATTYGAGSGTNYGHLKLSDSTTSTSGTSGGIAATPSAVKAVKDAIPAASTTNPSMDGTASYGSGTTYARSNHVHPTDTTRAPLASPTFTGTPKAPTAAAGTNTTQLATTAFVQSAIQTAQVGAATFKGTINANTEISNLTAYSKGWYWVVATAGTYVGQTCEVGDMIFCVKDRGTAYAASDFSVIQSNLDLVAITTAEIDTITAS